jgi:radical SAM superfamily enzyme YgiQ (UPF0313 family)
MADIVLTTLNAKYIHAAFGLRYLMANLGPLQPRATIREFDINRRPIEVAEALLREDPRIVGCGVYIWNTAPMVEVISILKRVRPGLRVIIGGPEVSHELERQPIVELADHVITGEADLKFAEVCAQLLNGQTPGTKVIPAGLPDFSQLELPYDFYTEADVRDRLIYVEASRGCPFSCEFCLSSLDVPVRQVPLPRMLSALEGLLARGVKHFKFVDRTFNLDVRVSRAILEFFLERYQPGLFFHFEMVPDRFPEGLREIVVRFPAGALQFEVGIQTFNEEVGGRIQRRQNYQRLEENLRFLRAQTGVHVHADLIAGLPGEDLESFAAGFDRLVAMGPQEIQVGLLKRLRGTPISRHDTEWQMVYNGHPPYEILQNRVIDFGTLQRVRRFARYWDLVGNSGNFIETTPLLWTAPNALSPFFEFLKWSDWLHNRAGRTDSIALVRLVELLFRYLVDQRGYAPGEVAVKLGRDYLRGGRKDVPEFLREFTGTGKSTSPVRRERPTTMKRQARHGLAPSLNPSNIST